MTEISTPLVYTVRDRTRRDVAVAASVIAAIASLSMLTYQVTNALADPGTMRASLTPAQQRVLMASCDLPRHYGEAAMFVATKNGTLSCWDWKIK